MTRVAAGNFMTWLRQQHKRADDVGMLAEAVRRDRRSAVMVSVQDLSKRLNQDEADWQMHDALERAEAEWRQRGGA